MARKYKAQEKNNNYSFLLKCMVAVTAAAVLTAGIIAAVVLNSTATSTTAIAATALSAKMMFATAFALTPILLPIALVAIGLACLLPSLFCCRSNTYSAISTNPVVYRHGGYGGFYSSYPSTHIHRTTPSSAYPLGGNVHGHPMGNVHGHDAGNIHRFPTPGTIHGHDTGNIHGHPGFGRR